MALIGKMYAAHFCLLFLTSTSILTFTMGKGNDDTNISEPRIISGDKTNIFKFPYEVSIRRKFCQACAFEHYCSGVIYETKVIITTANCVRSIEPVYTQIVAGTNFRSNAAQDGFVYPVEKIILHEDPSIDIAILHLSLDIQINNVTTKLVTMATELPRAGKMAVLAGWGQEEEFGSYSEELRVVHLPIIDHETCKSFYYWASVTDNEICAGHPNGGPDACKGDAGSPLLVDNKMVGIVSWGYGCARPGNPGVYTNVVHLSNWITKHV